MSGGLISKKLGKSWECPNQEFHRCSLRHCQNKRKEYRRKQHLLRKDGDNEKSRNRYREKYKTDPVWMKKRRDSWRKYAAKKGKKWNSARQKKYGNRNKKSSDLSPCALSKKRASYSKWAKQNWGKRVEYAKQYRRKKPAFGFRSKITEARNSGDIRKLASECLDAIIRASRCDYTSLWER